MFFPGWKAPLDFSVYALCAAVSWGLISSVRPPAFVNTVYGINNAALIFETLGYLFKLPAVDATFQAKKGRFYGATARSGIGAMGVGALVYG
ncbi:hypothetical protein GCM10011375_38150 [Hymenobacter qilianensis]|uniref:Uncharacterized protein n=1 Tax=Hymenobacter qilianensis TaxID=1385715 RepID=A0ACB5PWU5_9BACT|nr:hypothetical protein GCM10011375_38150 [Hymenobacter qilianensis]